MSPQPRQGNEPITKIKGGGKIINEDRGAGIPQNEIDILACRLLPEIRKYFADEEIRKEFAEWQRKRAEANKAVKGKDK
jgi:hypothetical protein